jgi:hypothetical protein
MYVIFWWDHLVTHHPLVQLELRQHYHTNSQSQTMPHGILISQWLGEDISWLFLGLNVVNCDQTSSHKVWKLVVLQIHVIGAGTHFGDSG